MVMRGVYFPASCKGELLWDNDSCPWVPYDKADIRLHGCGPELKAYMRGADER